MNKWEIKIYQEKTWNTEIKVKFINDTIWLNQEQISILFNVDRTVVSRC